MASMDTERAVLACILMDKADAKLVMREDLRHLPHQLIHEAILSGASDSVLVLNALPHLRRDLNAILETPGGAGNVEAYLKALRRDNRLSDIKKAAMEAVEHPERADAVALKMRELARIEHGKGPERIGEGLERMFLTGRPPAVPLGLRDLNALIGVREGHLAIVGARPRMGKTSLLTTFSLNAANAGWQVLFLSLEMSKVEIKNRCMAGYSGCSLESVNNASDEKMVTASAGYRELEIYLEADWEERGATKVSRLCALIERFAYLQADKPTVVMLDYLQIVRTDEKPSNRVEGIGEICRELKRTAKIAKVPIIAGAQLSRAADMRTSAVPQLSDLRESGEIEQIADQVILMHRDGAKAALHVAKNRHGVEGMAEVRFDGPTTLFSDAEYF